MATAPATTPAPATIILAAPLEGEAVGSSVGSLGCVGAADVKVGATVPLEPDPVPEGRVLLNIPVPVGRAKPLDTEEDCDPALTRVKLAHVMRVLLAKWTTTDRSPKKALLSGSVEV